MVDARELSFAAGWVDAFLFSGQPIIAVGERITREALDEVVRARTNDKNNLKIQTKNGRTYLCQNKKQ